MPVAVTGLRVRTNVDHVKLHDWFNLVTLGFLNILNCCYLVTGHGFLVFYTAAMVYFLLDIIFIGCYPNCVKSPIVLLCHHIVTSLYILIPYNYPQYHWCMAYCMLVEINTWFLIARRNIPSLLVEALFYVSWVLLRNVWYPYLVYAFYQEWLHESKKSGTSWNPILVCPIFQTVLVGLNAHWTVQLLRRKKSRKGGDTDNHL